jgi:alpha-beta hydrolase superfamily lysophospholipase
MILRAFKWMFIAAAALAGLIFTLTLGMILWGDPTFETPPDSLQDAIASAGIRLEQPYPPAARKFRMRDGTVLTSQYLAADSKTTIVLVHGLLASSFELNRTSGLLREAGNAQVVAIDLRGHGGSAGTPGDTDYIGQYEDDLADVITQIRAGRPGEKVILAGHSMGGGIALRYAMKSGHPPVDGYLLFAPYLGWTSPTTPKEAGDTKAAQTMNVHVPRILGLTLMNAAGITAFNGLRTYFFNLAPELPLRSYSYRAMMGMSPEDYRPALKAVDKPLLVVVGSRDEAFKADEYESVIHSYSKGAVTLIPEATHEGVLRDARTMAAVRTWIAEP